MLSRISPHPVRLLILAFALLGGVGLALGPRPAQAQSTSTPTATLTASPATATATATLTAIPATNTPTATRTVAPPTATPTATVAPPTATPTATEAPATSTPTATATPPATATPTATPTSTVTPTPTVVPLTLLYRYYTVPEIVRANEPFELFVTLQNRDAGIVQNIYVIPEKPKSEGDFVPADLAPVRFSDLTPGLQVTVSKGYRFLAGSATVARSGESKPLTLHFEYGPAVGANSISLYILVFPPLAVTDPATPGLERTFAQPNLIVRRSWTAMAGSTADNPQSVVLNEPFEIVLDLHNIGPVEAQNVYADFPLINDAFIPVGSTDRKYLTVSLGPDQHATVSQTLRPTRAGTPTAGGLKLDVTIGYDFRYAGQSVHKETTQTIGIYVITPTPTPAPTPITPTAAPPQAPVQVKEVVVTATAIATPPVPEPTIAVAAYRTDPQPIIQGEPFVVWLELQNNGPVTATNLFVEFPSSLVGARLTPAAASFWQYAPALGPKQTLTVSTTLQSEANKPSPGSQPLIATLQYVIGGVLQTVTRTQQITLTVQVMPPAVALQSGAPPTNEAAASALSSGIGGNQSIANSGEPAAAPARTLLSSRTGATGSVRIAAVGAAARNADGATLTSDVRPASQPRWLRWLLAFLGLGGAPQP